MSTAQASATPPEDYEPPVLGDAVAVAAVTLFSATVNPDAGVIDFGGG